MNKDKLELYAARVISGRFSLRVSSGAKLRTYLFIEPNSALRAEAAELYYYTKEKCIKRGLPTTIEAVANLIQRGLWSESEESKYKSLEEELEKLKIQLYKNRNKKNEVRIIKSAISEVREKIYILFCAKNLFYSNTADAVASSKKMRFLVGSSLFKNDGATRVWEGRSFWSDRRSLLEDATSSYLTAKPDQSELREIARNEPFRSVWATREATGNLFERGSVSLSEDQKGLIIWAKLYQNAREDTEHPEDFVFEDDEMFDGWLSIRQDEVKKNADKSDSTTSNTKISNSEMIFAVVGEEGCGYTKDEIFNLNSDNAKAMMTSRINQLEQKGELNEYEFGDRRHAQRMANARNSKS